MSKKLLITGGAGFIGHALIEHVIKYTDWSIVSVDRLDYSGNLNRLHEVASGLSVLDKKRLCVIFHDLKAEINPMLASQIGQIDIICHLAASSHVDRSITDPRSFVMDNVVGTVNMLEFARSIPNLEKFIYFSTDEIFGPAESGIHFRERDRYNCTNPYSATKAGAEELCVSYHNTYHLPVGVVRLMNVFGPRQHPEKFIPLCIKKVLSEECVNIHSDSTLAIPGSRHYLHTSDVAEAILFLLGMPRFPVCDDISMARCPKFNLAGPEEIDNLLLADTIARCIGKPLKYELVDFHSSRPGHDLRYSLDGSYLARLGWHPKSKISQRIYDTVQWYLQNPKWLMI